MPDADRTAQLTRRLQWAGLNPEDVTVRGSLVTLTLPTWELDQLIGQAADARAYRVDL